jgi:regulator of protease activity HflC (stomatin/prohibitin superfamily)
MSKSQIALLLIGLALGVVLLPALFALVRAVTVQVNEKEIVVVTRRGELVRAFETAGLHFFPSKLLPWIQRRHVSLRLDFLHFERLEIEPRRGGPVAIDLWVEFRVGAVPKALAACNAKAVLAALVAQTTRAVVAREEEPPQRGDRLHLERRLELGIRREASRCGITIERVFVNRIAPSAPESARTPEARLGASGRWLH